MSSVLLPNEIIDGIIDQLHSDNKALSVCALVSSTWVPAVRFHRFTRVRVPTPSNKRFFALVQDSPAIAPYIQDLSLSSHGEVKQDVEPQLCGLFSILVNLRVLSLSLINFIADRDQAIRVLESLPRTIEVLEMWQIEFPSVGHLILWLISLPRLRSFTVIGVCWITARTISDDTLGGLGDAVTSVTSHLPLSELHLRWSIRYLDILVDWLCAHHVPAQLLRCSLYLIEPEEREPISKILHALGPNLQTLELYTSGEYDKKPYPGCGLAQCTGLQELRLYASQERVREWRSFDFPLDWAPGFLRQVRTTSIKTVILAFEWGFQRPNLDVLADIASALERETFRSLTRVVVRFSDTWKRWQGVDEDARQTIQKHLRVFHEQGMLQVERV